MLRVEPVKASNYKVITIGEVIPAGDAKKYPLNPSSTRNDRAGKCPSVTHPTLHSQPTLTHNNVRGLLAVSENKKYSVVALVDNLGFLKVVPTCVFYRKAQESTHSECITFSYSPILRVPLGNISLLWGPSHHGLALCVVVANVGIIIIRCSSSLGKCDDMPHPFSWYEDRISTVDCDSIDFESGSMCVPFSTDTLYTAPPHIFEGRSSFTVVGAAFSPFSSDLLVFFEGRPAVKIEHSSVVPLDTTRRSREGCRAVLFRRGGNAQGTPTNTWVAIRKSLRLLRDLLKTDNDPEEDEPANKSEGPSDRDGFAFGSNAEGSLTRSNRRRRTARAIQSVEHPSKPPSSILFCRVSWHPQFKITSRSYVFDIAVEKPLSTTDSRTQAEGEADKKDDTSSNVRAGEREMTNLTAHVTFTCNDTNSPLSVLAVVGTDGFVRIVDMSLLVSGSGGELLVLDVSAYSLPGNNSKKGLCPKIQSVDWAPRLGSLSVLVVTTAEHLIVFYISFHCSSVTITTSVFGKKTTPVIRRRPHTINWATIEDYSIRPFHGVAETKVPAGTLNSGTAGDVVKTQHWPDASAWPLKLAADEEIDVPFSDPEGGLSLNQAQAVSLHDHQPNHTFGVSPVSFSGSNATSNAARSHNAAEAATAPNPATSTRPRKSQPALLQSQQHAYEANTLVRASIPKTDKAISVFGIIPVVLPRLPITVNTTREGLFEVIVPSQDSFSYFRLRPPTRDPSTLHWFPLSPAVVRLREWCEFFQTHSDEHGIIHFTFSDTKCGRRKPAIPSDKKLTISMSTQQLKETNRTLALIMEMTTNPDKTTAQTLSDKVFGFLVKTCRRITASCKEEASVQHAAPTDTQRVVKLHDDGTISVTTHETFQSAKVATTRHVNLKAKNLESTSVESGRCMDPTRIHFVRL